MLQRFALGLSMNPHSPTRTNLISPFSNFNYLTLPPLFLLLLLRTLCIILDNLGSTSLREFPVKNKTKVQKVSFFQNNFITAVCHCIPFFLLLLVVLLPPPPTVEESREERQRSRHRTTEINWAQIKKRLNRYKKGSHRYVASFPPSSALASASAIEASRPPPPLLWYSLGGGGGRGTEPPPPFLFPFRQVL